MNITDKLYTEWAWRSKTGTPSMDNAEDRALLDTIIGEATDKNKPVTPDDIISLISSISDDQEALQYLRRYIRNRPNQNSFFDYIKLQNIDDNTLQSGDAAQRVFNVLADNDDLENYMLYIKKTVSFSDLGVRGNILSKFNGKLSGNSVKSLINIGGQEGGRGVGKAEIGLSTLIGDVKMMKGEKGDLDWGGKYLEVKGSAARLGKRDHSFTGGAEIIDTLEALQLDTNRPDSFMPALFNISQDREDVDYKKSVEQLNKLLNQVYDEEYVKRYITPENCTDSNRLRVALQKVYAASYAKREGVAHFIFVDTNTSFGDYLSLAPEQLMTYIGENPKKFSSPISLKNGLAPQIFRSGIK